MSEKKVTAIITPIPPGELRVARIEYSFHFNMPGGSGGWLKIEGTFEQDLEQEAKALLRLLVENGWMSNPVISRTIYYDRHTSFHAEYDEKITPPPKV